MTNKEIFNIDALLKGDISKKLIHTYKKGEHVLGFEYQIPSEDKEWDYKIRNTFSELIDVEKIESIIYDGKEYKEYIEE